MERQRTLGREQSSGTDNDDCAFYDVPYSRYASGPDMVRVLMSADKSFVITVVPPQSPGELARQRVKQHRDGSAEQRKRFLRGFEDDEDCVTL